MDDYLDTIIDVENFVRDTSTATWRNSITVQVIQFVLIAVSFIDFSIYTTNFLYGLALAFRTLQKFEKLMTVFVAVVFLMARFLYLPFMLLLVPFDHFPLFPKVIYRITLIGLAFLYLALLILPLFFAISFAIKYRIWRNADRNDARTIRRAKRRVKKRIRKNRIANMIVVMPIYNEEPDALLTDVQSIVDSVYPSFAISVYLSFDSDEHSPLFIHLMKFLTKSEQTDYGAKKRFQITYQGINFVINLFRHGGKRNTQALTFQEISNTYRGRENGTFVLFIDSDIILHGDCMLEFLRALEKNKGLVGMTGFISAISSGKGNFYWYLQDCEYVVGQIFARSLEAALGGVTCLPGALTIVRLRELSQAANTYFSELPNQDIFDFHRYHLGEDRYLTHLLMEQSQSYSIGFCPSARAKTEAPGTWITFLKQRRRWLLGAFSNEVYFLADYRLWLRVPFLLFYKILDFSSRSAAFFVYIVLFQLLTGVKYSAIQSAIIWSPLIANWFLLLIFAVIIRRFKVFWMYPVMIMLNPWIYFFVNIYSIMTWNLRSWGGPRAVESKAEPMENLNEVLTENPIIPPSLLELRLQAGDVILNDRGYDSAGSSDSTFGTSDSSLDDSDDDSSIGSRSRSSFYQMRSRAGSASSLNSYTANRPASSSQLAGPVPKLFAEN